MGTELEQELHVFSLAKAAEARTTHLELLRVNMGRLAEYLKDRARSIRSHVSSAARRRSKWVWPAGCEGLERGDVGVTTCAQAACDVVCDVGGLQEH